MQSHLAPLACAAAAGRAGGSCQAAQPEDRRVLRYPGTAVMVTCPNRPLVPRPLLTPGGSRASLALCAFVAVPQRIPQPLLPAYILLMLPSLVVDMALPSSRLLRSIKPIQPASQVVRKERNPNPNCPQSDPLMKASSTSFLSHTYLINKTRSTTRKVEEHSWFTCTGAKYFAIPLAERNTKRLTKRSTHAQLLRGKQDGSEWVVPRSSASSNVLYH
ncbi:hCG1997364, partial [Homo sapiens]|uniref:Putative cat eye syndrome critical region protein 9 n=1 Tax=Homo sapiens TaxID=9606 RepID=CECR9_HUMAN